MSSEWNELMQAVVRNGVEFMDEMIRNLIELAGFDKSMAHERLKERMEAEGWKITIYTAPPKVGKPYLRYIRLTKEDHFIAGYVVELKGTSSALHMSLDSLKYHGTLIEDDEQDETAVKYLSGALDHLTVERKGEENV